MPDMPAYELDEALLRLVEMQQEAMFLVTPSVVLDSVPYWPYQQEVAPYWWNRINSLEVEDIADDIMVDRWEIEMGLVVDHITAGYRGENTARVANWITAILAYFDDHRELTTSATWTGTQYLTGLNNLFEDEGGAFVAGIPQGLRSITNAGQGATQLYVGFILHVPLLRQVY